MKPAIVSCVALCASSKI